MEIEVEDEELHDGQGRDRSQIAGSGIGRELGRETMMMVIHWSWRA